MGTVPRNILGVPSVLPAAIEDEADPSIWPGWSPSGKLKREAQMRFGFD